ncbi:hypothetical protein RNJ44_00711 [Nakaseomyces bracarensis]|uniref:DUF155 domain-containing protein n=1 Tax=Nakaseomyces bracarensis TaxID=273131 RepID=A0ABR4NS80_9SACH
MSYKDPMAEGAMPKRSPSILVTDSRSSKKRSSAPFAGHAAGVRNTSVAVNSEGQKRSAASSGGGASSLSQYGTNHKHDMGSGNSGKRRSSGRFSEISIDNILSASSDVPSGRREERGSTSSWDRNVYDKLRRAPMRKMINALPTRTSKTSQKLVLIPEDSNVPPTRGPLERREQPSIVKKSPMEHIPKNIRDHKLSRITAYNLAEGFNLKLLSKFLKVTHEVKPRLYDECLYIAYTLPLLPGKDGFRLKSNISKKVVGGKTLIEKLIDTSEQRDHHYEYYSGVETLEDANNNYELDSTAIADPENNNNGNNNNNGSNQDNFDPSEPQFFAEETPIEQEQRERSERMSIDAGNRRHSMVPNEEDQHAEIFVFHYGVVVFWNFTEEEEKNILGDIAFSDYKNLVVRPLDEQDIEIEQFHFEYDKDTERPRIFNDIITLRSGDHIIKLTLAHAIAQSSKLSRFESRISPILTTVTRLPKRLALYGTLGLKREQLIKKSGKLFKLRVDVNLSSSVLDTPEFFWSFEPSLHPLYVAMREYLEIDQRVQVLNDRCMVFLEFFDICVDSIAERNIVRVTWWFFVAVIVCIVFSLIEIFIRSLIIRRLKQ